MQFLGHIAIYLNTKLCTFNPFLSYNIKFMKTIQLAVTIEAYDNHQDFTEQEQQLFATARKACLNAHAPYSKFQVGAAVLLADGQVFEGNNQENAAYPSGLCAERVAIFYASATNPNTPVKAIAVTINYDLNPNFDEIVSPCGGCRQVLVEYEHKFGNNITIYMVGKNERVYVVRSMKQLMPMSFSGDVLADFGNK